MNVVCLKSNHFVPEIRRTPVGWYIIWYQRNLFIRQHTALKEVVWDNSVARVTLNH